MTCREIVILLPEYVRRRLLVAQEAAVRAHLSICPACAAAYEDELAFGALVHGTDAPAPPILMAQVMADIRAEPRQAAPFRVRALDFVLAIGAALAVGGLVFGLLSLWTISPIITDRLDPGTLLAGDLTVRTMILAALWAIVGLCVSLPIAATIHAVLTRGRRAPVWWSR
ncbi:MAG TPA: zf-HC2 domain-containing protein [Thermomicrobiales bacterium]